MTGSIWDYSTTPGSNTAIAGINIAPGCPSSSVGPALREILADVKGSLIAITAGGTADAITATMSPAPSALVDGMRVAVRFGAANTLTTSTFQLNGLGTAGTIKKLGGSAIAAGDIAGAGHVGQLEYVSSDNHWELLNPAKANATANTFTGTQTFSGAATFNGAADFVGQAYSPEAALPAVTGTVTLDLSTGNNFGGTLTGNITLANPSNALGGQSGAIRFTQDATGSRTITFGTSWKFQGGVKPPLTTTASAVDVLTYYVVSPTLIIANLVSNVS